ncbi:HAD family hydrolase [Fodinicola acaciae]|uniref:HAD family hydrolase n=1 Tax=Fodinicola acaciae TaxID=2681555 RepID=UPI0013D5F0F1|nr:HAD family hydrolase [Fodinicola acaciae]
MSLPGMIACDLDGTLLRSDLSVSDRTVAALAAVRTAGVPFVVVTGRPVRWLGVVLDRIGRYAEVICSNGAKILDVDGSVLIAWPITPPALEIATRRLRDALGDVHFAVERDAGMVKESGYRVRQDLAQPRDVAWDELVSQPALKLLVRVPGADGDELLARCTGLLRGLATPTHSSLASGLVEVSADGVNKAAALDWLADRHGVRADQVLAFGDMPNDISMLRWAGRSVVVADAHPEAKAAADEVTESNDNDGVAVVLERLLD